MTVVLALDIAKNRTGWARGSAAPGSIPRWGVFETVNWDGNEGPNLKRWRELLCGELLDGCTHLAMENIFVDVRGAAAKAFNFSGTQAQMMLAGVAILIAEERGIPQLSVDCDHWRMRFLGLNRRPKDSAKDSDYWKRLALKVAAQQHNWFCHHHDEAEALGILHYALGEIDRGYKDRTNGAFHRNQLDITMGRGLHER